MRRLFRYELKRLLLNKFYIGLLAITAVYSYQTLTGVIIRGVGYTAPFSGWSYGSFIATIAPLLSVTLLFFITFLYTAKEKRVATVTGATPIDPRKYAAVRYGAMLVGYLIMALMVIGISLWFYRSTFQFTQFSSFLLPMLIVLLPMLLLTFGAGILLGRIHVGFLYGLMVVFLAIGTLPLPAWMEITGGQYFAGMPMTMEPGPAGEPALTLSGAFIGVRALMVVAGIAMIALAFIKMGKQARQTSMLAVK